MGRLDIHPMDPIAVGSATEGVDGFNEMDNPSSVRVFTVGDDKTYAIVTGRTSNSVQLIDVTDPANPIALSTAVDGVNGFTELGGAWAVDTFTAGDGKTYAIVPSYDDNGVQLMTFEPSLFAV